MKSAKFSKKARKANKAFRTVTADLESKAGTMIHVRLPEKVLETQKIVEKTSGTDTEDKHRHHHLEFIGTQF